MSLDSNIVGVCVLEYMCMFISLLNYSFQIES